MHAEPKVGAKRLEYLMVEASWKNEQMIIDEVGGTMDGIQYRRNLSCSFTLDALLTS